MTTRPSRWWRRRRESVQDAELVAALATAMIVKDAAGIRRLLDAEVTMVVDGGPLDLGGELIGRDVAAVELLSYPPDLAVVGINGAPGIVARRDGEVVATVSAVARRGLIVTLWSVRNPDKLRHWDS
ncbi:MULTISPECIES: siderophore-interacting protein [unclassified Microbacterium]|uniref:siderophore-interacting protein n=1 Tax=unclassified Microbacterium TaxID=2609290 RepID=UPI0010571B67|nr:siderophore-interacting protein [Microbacterium sp. TPD7012]